MTTKKLNTGTEDQEIKDGSPLAILLLIQNAVHQRCSLFACSLLTRLTTHRNGETGLICPSGVTLADHFGVSERQVRYGLKELTDAGFIFIKRRANASSLISLNWAMAVRADLKRQRNGTSVDEPRERKPYSVAYQTEQGNGSTEAEATEVPFRLGERQRNGDDQGNGSTVPTNLTEENLSESKTNLSEATTLKGGSEKTVKDNMEETNDQQAAIKEPPKQFNGFDLQLGGQRPPNGPQTGNGPVPEDRGPHFPQSLAELQEVADEIGVSVPRAPPAEAKTPGGQQETPAELLAFNSAVDVSAAFARFWKPWRRGKKSKKATRVAFAKLLVAGVDPEQIIAGAECDAKTTSLTPDKWLAQFRAPIIATVDTLLRIPYGNNADNKEEALALGARYLNGRWYAPAGTDLAQFKARGWLLPDTSAAAIAEANRRQAAQDVIDKQALAERIRQEEEKLRAASLVDAPQPAPAEPKEVERPNIAELFVEPPPPLDLVAIAKAETAAPWLDELLKEYQ